MISDHIDGDGLHYVSSLQSFLVEGYGFQLLNWSNAQTWLLHLVVIKVCLGLRYHEIYSLVSIMCAKVRFVLQYIGSFMMWARSTRIDGSSLGFLSPTAAVRGCFQPEMGTGHWSGEGCQGTQLFCWVCSMYEMDWSCSEPYFGTGQAVPAGHEQKSCTSSWLMWMEGF